MKRPVYNAIPSLHRKKFKLRELKQPKVVQIPCDTARSINTDSCIIITQSYIQDLLGSNYVMKTCVLASENISFQEGCSSVHSVSLLCVLKCPLSLKSYDSDETIALPGNKTYTWLESGQAVELDATCLRKLNSQSCATKTPVNRLWSARRWWHPVEVCQCIWVSCAIPKNLTEEKHYFELEMRSPCPTKYTQHPVTAFCGDKSTGPG